MSRYCFINGEMFPEDKACITVADLGLQRGYAIFEYVRIYNNKLFHIHDHLERLRRSASELHLTPPYSDEKIIEAAMMLHSKSRLKKPAIRIIMTGGYAWDELDFSKSNFIISTEELPHYPASLYTNGGKLITFEYRREIPHVKTTNYLNAIRLEPIKRKKGASDILYYWGNKVTECPRDNFFIFSGETLVTPKHNMLHGITRKLILQLAGAHFNVEERDITLQEVGSANEAFTTSTTKQVTPIVQVDDNKIGTGSIGERTKAIVKLFHDYTKSY